MKMRPSPLRYRERTFMPTASCVRAATLAIVACALTACATPPSSSQATPAPSESYRQVLAQPDRLQPVPGDAEAVRWIDPNVNFRQYNAILIERIRVRLDPSSSSVDPNDLKAL